ncbi:MAG: thioredoxin family protein [Pseudomonadota bacterium]|nr:thioredoxin family protein [Pseudomonadota bacterium]
MISLQTPICNFGEKAPEFKLVQNQKTYTLNEVRDEKGLLVIFMCNHCPYVKCILPDLVITVHKCQAMKIGCLAIMSNDINDYPEDSPKNMKALSESFHFSFPYLYDASQEIAKKFGAICTPDFFGYNSNLELQYRGRFDSRGKSTGSFGNNDLIEAMHLIALTGSGPKNQSPSIGCSIKWKNQNK